MKSLANKLTLNELFSLLNVIQIRSKLNERIKIGCNFERNWAGEPVVYRTLFTINEDCLRNGNCCTFHTFECSGCLYSS